MNHFAHVDLIRVHDAELRRVADHHRLVNAARGTAGRSGVAHLLTRATRSARERLPGIVEAEPCSP